MNEQQQSSITKLPVKRSGQVSESLMEDLFRPLTVKEVFKKYRNGIYVSVIVVMLLVIFLLAYRIGEAVGQPYDFTVISFVDDDKVAPDDVEELMNERDRLEEEVNRMLREGYQRPTPNVRNVVVNTDANQSTFLRDSKGINQSVYDEAQSVQDRLDASRDAMRQAQEAANNTVPVYNPDTNSSQGSATAYQGPSVLSFTLTGRNAVNVPIPAYKCERGGDVTVIIWVNRKGYVEKAEVDKARSTHHADLQEEALKAARRSRFSASTSAPERQQGEIVYRFIAQ